MTTEILAGKIRAYLDGVIAMADAATGEGLRVVTRPNMGEPLFEVWADCGTWIANASTKERAAFIADARTTSPQMARALLGVLNPTISYQSVYDAPEARDMAEVVVREMARGLGLLEADDD